MSSTMRSNCTNAQLHIKSRKEIAVDTFRRSQICSFGGADPAGNRGYWMFARAMVGTDLPPLGYSVIWFSVNDAVHAGFAAHLAFALKQFLALDGLRYPAPWASSRILPVRVFLMMYLGSLWRVSSLLNTTTTSG